MTPKQFINRYDPCKDAEDWLLTQPSLEVAYTSCERGNWLLWALVKLGYDHKKLVKLTCKIIRLTPANEGKTVGDIMPSESRNALAVVECWAGGKATDKELSAAADAAAWAARAARDAARAATNNAAWAAWVARAAASVWAAADSAVWAARAASAASAAGAADTAGVEADSRKWQADYIRSRIPFSEIANLLN